MAGELNLKHTASGVTILALILGQNRTTRWNGTALVAISSVSDANWTTGMITLTEQQTSNNTRTAIYVGDFPLGIATPGEYVVEYYLSTAATPGSPSIGVQDIWWKGTALATIPAIQTKTDNLPASPAAVGDAMTLTSAYDAAKTAASQTTVNAVKTKTDNLPASPAAVGDAMTLTQAYDAAKTAAQPGAAMTLTSAYNAAKTAAQAGDAMTLTLSERNAIAAALLDLANAIDGKTLRQALQIIAAVTAGKVSGAGSGTESFRSLSDSTTRVVVAADVLGNRTNVTYQ